MEIDFTKQYFEQTEVIYFNKNLDKLSIPINHIPIVFVIDSKVIEIRKPKIIISRNNTLKDLENVFKKLIECHNQEDIFEYRINDKLINHFNIKLGDLYDNYKNSQLNCLIIKVNRITLTRYLKNFFK
jgi:stress response protein SCP2